MSPIEYKKWHIGGLCFTLTAGTLLHFVYEWSGESKAASLFSAVNESTWEHLKLLITPMILFGLLEYFVYGRKRKNFIPVRVLSILVGMAVIVTVFYTYSGIVGRNFLPADIGTFFLGGLFAYLYGYRMMEKEAFASKGARALGYFGLAAIVLSMIVFTFDPPHIGLFIDPNTGGYGI